MRVVLCDDHPVYRDGLRSLLTELGVDVVAEAGDGHEGVRLAIEHVPDVVVMDLHMPECNGVEATRRIVEARPQVRVLVLTMLDDDMTLFAALRAGASGYLLKGARHEEIERVLKAVVQGDIVVSGSAAPRLRSGLRAPAASGAFPQLTVREHEILDLLARGRTNESIASALFLSSKTVRNKVSTIFTKLGVSTRAEAIALARDAGVGA